MHERLAPLSIAALVGVAALVGACGGAGSPATSPTASAPTSAPSSPTPAASTSEPTTPSPSLSVPASHATLLAKYRWTPRSAAKITSVTLPPADQLGPTGKLPYALVLPVS